MYINYACTPAVCHYVHTFTAISFVSLALLSISAFFSLAAEKPSVVQERACSRRPLKACHHIVFFMYMYLTVGQVNYYCYSGILPMYPHIHHIVYTIIVATLILSLFNTKLSILLLHTHTHVPVGKSELSLTGSITEVWS